MLPSKTENLEEQVYHKWPDIVRKNQKAAGRQLLSRLVEENMKRLVDKLEAFCPEACGKKVFKKQSFDDSPEGKRLKIQVQKLDASVNRRLSKIRKECRGDQGDSGSRRAWRDAGKEPKRVGGAGWRVAGVDEDSARRAQAEGTTIVAAPATDVAEPEHSNSMVDRVRAHGFAGAAEVSPSVSVSANSSSDPHPDPLPEAVIFWGGFIFNIVDMIVGPTALRNRVDACERRALRLGNAPHRLWPGSSETNLSFRKRRRAPSVWVPRHFASTSVREPSLSYRIRTATYFEPSSSPP